MQEDKKEFTLKQMVEILKKGWLTILIYVLVAAIIFGSVAAIVKTVATTNEYRAKIGFVSTVEPDALNDLYSSDTINKALLALNMNEEDIPGYIDLIRSSISITPVVYSTQTDTETQFVPSSYLVTMSEINGLSESKSVQVLNQMVVTFIEEYNFKNTSSTITTENEQAFANYTSKDYVEIAYELQNKIQAMMKVAQSLSYRTSSINKEFSNLHANLEVLDKSITSFEEYVVVKGITKSVLGLTAEEYLNMMITNAQSEQVMYEAVAQKWKEIADSVIANQSPSVSVDGGIIVGEGDSEAYYEFLSKYMEAEKSAAEANAEVSYWQAKLAKFQAATAFPDATEDDQAKYIKESDDRVAEYVDATIQMIERYNSLVQAYNSSGLASSSSANLITPAYAVSTSMISNTVMLLIIVLAVVVAALTGFVRVRSKYIVSIANAQTNV